jgi:hypothetical protein
MKMNRATAIVACAACIVASNSQAAGLLDFFIRQPDRPVARLADQDLGYSVIYPNSGSRNPRYRVLVTCTERGGFSTTFCPAPKYVAVCPIARIICR